MKRMSEVFELPVSPSDVGLWMDNEALLSALNNHAAHAINSIDALDCALFDCIELIENLGLQSSDAYQSAIAALNAYRGAK